MVNEEPPYEEELAMQERIEANPAHYQSNKRRVFACRVLNSTPEYVDQLAERLGYVRVNGDSNVVGSTGALLDAIADGTVKVILH